MLYNRNNTAIISSNDITPRDMFKVLRAIQANNLYALFISSPGGAASNLLYGLNHLLPRKITTIAGEEVASAALSLFLCGNERFALPNSTFTFHEAGEGIVPRRICKIEADLLMEIALMEGRFADAALMAKKVSIMKSIDKLTAEFLQSRTRLSADMVMKLMHGEGCTLNAKEALYYGFIHGIINPSLIQA